MEADAAAAKRWWRLRRRRRPRKAKAAGETVKNGGGGGGGDRRRGAETETETETETDGDVERFVRRASHSLAREIDAPRGRVVPRTTRCSRCTGGRRQPVAARAAEPPSGGRRVVARGHGGERGLAGQSRVDAVVTGHHRSKEFLVLMQPAGVEERCSDKSCSCQCHTCIGAVQRNAPTRPGTTQHLARFLTTPNIFQNKIICLRTGKGVFSW